MDTFVIGLDSDGCIFDRLGIESHGCSFDRLVIYTMNAILTDDVIYDKSKVNDLYNWDWDPKHNNVMGV